jgi:hypothetical protein
LLSDLSLAGKQAEKSIRLNEVREPRTKLPSIAGKTNLLLPMPGRRRQRRL